MSSNPFQPVPPAGAEPITMTDKLIVPDRPIIPHIVGDGTGPDIWRAARHVLDGAVARAYGSTRQLGWTRVLAGEESFQIGQSWLPDETIEAFQTWLVGLKGPLTTPVGGGIRSLNVALRQTLDLYVCLRPVRWFSGVPSPVKRPDQVDMVIFRENTEDIYAGLEFQAGTDDAARFAGLLAEHFPERFAKVRFPATCGYGVKPVSREGTERLVAAAIRYAVANGRRSVTLVHKGNIMKFTEGAFRQWGYDLVRRDFADVAVAWDDCNGEPGDKILVKDAIADIFLQQILTRPAEFDVVATLNLNGDYISDALAAQVGGIGIAPGANINYDTGHAIFEATHGTAPKYAGLDQVNPGSVILSGELMLRYLGWTEAADLILAGLERTIAAKTVTYDFHRLMDGATLLKCSEFGRAVVENMG